MCGWRKQWGCKDENRQNSSNSPNLEYSNSDERGTKQSDSGYTLKVETTQFIKVDFSCEHETKRYFHKQWKQTKK